MSRSLTVLAFVIVQLRYRDSCLCRPVNASDAGRGTRARTRERRRIGNLGRTCELHARNTSCQHATAIRVAAADAPLRAIARWPGGCYASRPMLRQFRPDELVGFLEAVYRL